MKLIIDADPGIDDAMAILFAALRPELEIIGLTSVFGNVTARQATRNALVLCDMAGLSCPVAKGADRALALPLAKPSSHVHGPEGFGSLPAMTPKRPATNEDAAAFMIRTARAAKGEITICAIGPITNVAQAMRRDPEFARNVAGIVLMGGAVHVPGNITPMAEANTYHDPHALAEVIASGASVTLVGLDVTMQALCTASDFDRLARENETLGGFLRQIGAFYLDFYASIGAEGCGLHDPAAVIACFRPDLFEITPTRLDVILEGAEIGRTLPADHGPVVNVCTDGDMVAVKELFLSSFAMDRDAT